VGPGCVGAKHPVQFGLGPSLSAEVGDAQGGIHRHQAGIFARLSLNVVQDLLIIRLENAAIDQMACQVLPAGIPELDSQRGQTGRVAGRPSQIQANANQLSHTAFPFSSSSTDQSHFQEPV
jgi:hypothetical protein